MTTASELLTLFASGQLPEIPEECECRAELVQLHAYLTELVRFTGAMAAGDLSASLRNGGPLAGRLKGLHANLRHLTWQTQQVATGDFSQRVACLGEFSTAFNQMVEALAQARQELLMTKNSQLATAYKDLKAAQSQLLQQEKMASIGQLAAGVAHEINNPMGFILSNLGTLDKYRERLLEFIDVQAEAIEKLTVGAGEDALAMVKAKRVSLRIDQVIADIDDLITESIEGGVRVKQIVMNLKNFSHIDEAAQQAIDVNAALEDTLAIIWNELKDKAEIIKEYGKLPLLLCNAGQLNQVFLNILINAVYAIASHGVIRITTRCSEEAVEVVIADNGCGVPPEVVDRIFEPFFTTKDVGKGTGLGLSIVYDIIKKQQGGIKVESEVGQGTIFTITLPLNPTPGGAEGVALNSQNSGANH